MEEFWIWKKQKKILSLQPRFYETMEDIVITVPTSDAGFVTQLMEKMGYLVKSRKYQGERSSSFRQIFDRMSIASDHDWTLSEINAEINAARQQARV